MVFDNFSYFDFDECHKKNGIANDGRVIIANATQSNKCDEKRLLKSAKPTIPPSPGSELIAN